MKGRPFQNFLTKCGSHLAEMENPPHTASSTEMSLSPGAPLIILHINPSVSFLGAVSETTINACSNYKEN